MNKAFGVIPPPAFAGWGMQTDALTPWHDGGGDELARDFLRTHEELLERVASKKMVLSQFETAGEDIAARLRGLMWRHYVVFWSCRYAARATDTAPKILVECGVCDGLSSFFAMSAVKGRYPFRAFLYDAWQAMEERFLLPSERVSAGSYGYLSIENTKRNLAPFEPDAVFIRGFVPEVFAPGPESPTPVWLHIDLNSSQPTAAALREFVDRMPPGSVILLDDYAWRSFSETKVVTDQLLANRHGILLPMPTGQGIFFKLRA